MRVSSATRRKGDSRSAVLPRFTILTFTINREAPLAVFGGSSEDVSDQLRSTLSEETKLMSTLEPTFNPMEKSAALNATRIV